MVNSESASKAADPKKAQRRRRLRIVLVAAGLLLLLAGGLGYGWWIGDGISRFYAFAGYANALSYYYYGESRATPPLLKEIEDKWNDWDGCLVQIPSAPWFLRPSYRPLDVTEGGPYIVFVETKPPGLHAWNRYVIYARPDGSIAKITTVSESDLDSVIAADDALRKQNAQAAGQWAGGRQPVS